MAKEMPFDHDEIVRRLADLPGWRAGDGVIERRYRTAGWKATMMIVTTIGHLCEVAWHHPTLLVGYDSVLVTLFTHTAKGVTAKDIELARKIEAVIGWRPALEGGSLTGTPDDPRHAYIRND